MKSKKKYPISVFIIAKNEEERITKVIESVKAWANEVIVVDSGSIDKTLELAKKAGATKVTYNKWQGFGPQKAFAENLCKNNWVFNLDADEICSHDLSHEIMDLFKHQKISTYSAYKVCIKIKPRFSKNIFNFAPQDIVIRLYDKSKAGYDKSIIHDSVIVQKGKTGELKNNVIHNCFLSYKHAIDKINYYTSLQAEHLFKKGRNPSAMRIICEPFFAFFKAYFLNKYIFWGLEGFIEACIYSFSKTLRLAKAKELFYKAKK